jgi:5-methylcytosine-specific restriction endonuclease McrA
LAIHRVKVNKDPRDCIYCGKPFIPKTNVMKYCSAKCSRKCELEKAHKARELQPKSYSAWYRLRFSIMVRDGFRCQYCGRTAQDAGVKLEVDHILAKNNGGSNNPSNLITCCSDCNIGKSGLFLLTKDGDIPTYLTFKILSNLSSKQTIPKATALQF